MRHFIKLSPLLFIFCLSSAHAIDPLTLVQDAELIKTTLDQIEHIKRLQSTLNEQLNTLNAQKKVLEDTQAIMQSQHDYSSKFDNPTLSQWRHSGKEWSGLLNSHTDQNKDALAVLAKQIEREFPLKSKDSVFSQKNSEQATMFDLLAKTTLASRATNTLAYNNIEEELAMLEALQKEIDKSPNQKASLDLIARIQIETAKMNAYKIKSDAVSAQLASLQSQQEVSDAKWASEFFKWQ